MLYQNLADSGTNETKSDQIHCIFEDSLTSGAGVGVGGVVLCIVVRRARAHDDGFAVEAEGVTEDIIVCAGLSMVKVMIGQME